MDPTAAGTRQSSRTDPSHTHTHTNTQADKRRNTAAAAESHCHSHAHTHDRTQRPSGTTHSPADSSNMAKTQLSLVCERRRGWLPPRPLQGDTRRTRRLLTCAALQWLWFRSVCAQKHTQRQRKRCRDGFEGAAGGRSSPQQNTINADGRIRGVLRRRHTDAAAATHGSTPKAHTLKEVKMAQRRTSSADRL